MAKKASGLGRGLGELLEDNAPQVHGVNTVRRETAQPSASTPSPAAKPKPLYEERPQNKSLKANFRNFNR